MSAVALKLLVRARGSFGTAELPCRPSMSVSPVDQANLYKVVPSAATRGNATVRGRMRKEGLQSSSQLSRNCDGWCAGYEERTESAKVFIAASR